MEKSRRFRLISDYSAAGDQPQAIEKLARAFHEGKRKLTLLGVTGSGKTYTMAAFIEKIQKPALVLTHNKTLAAQLYREFREFFPENAVEYFVSYYDYYQPEAYVPSSDTYIEKDASVNDEIDRLRLRATSSLLERRDVLIVSSVSCIYGLGSPEDYQNSMLLLDTGIELDRQTVMKRLLQIQYNRNDLDFSRGNFRVRGDTIEVFPAYRQEGIRISWFGDEIESLAFFDPLTGRITDKTDRVAIYPAKHFITTPPKLKEALARIDEELKERVAELQAQGKLLEAQRLASRTKYDMEMLEQMGYCNGIENYSRHLSLREKGEAPATLLSYFPDDFVVIIDESHVTIPQVRGMFEGDRSRKQTLVDFGFRLPSALDNRPLNFEEFEKIVKNVLFVSATPAEYELRVSEFQAEQIIRPTGLLDPEVEVRPIAGQMEDLEKEIRLRIAAGERTLVTTLTKKMAEDLADYLEEKGIKVSYLHSEIETIERVEIIRDLRQGIYDAVIGVNLLREGLDIPEVSLVAILDADKEGFLRNERSLIQTIGRAARNANGKAILYADSITGSMERAIAETKRRRTIQMQYNQEHGITPKTITKGIQDIIERHYADQSEEEAVLASIEQELDIRSASSKKEILDNLRELMLKAAKELDFERAALIRDKMKAIEEGKDIKGETKFRPYAVKSRKGRSGRKSR